MPRRSCFAFPAATKPHPKGYTLTKLPDTEPMKLGQLLFLLVSALFLVASTTACQPEDTEQASANAESVVAMDDNTDALDENPLLVDWDTPFGTPPARGFRRERLY